jgi:hypothetical protein
MDMEKIKEKPIRVSKVMELTGYSRSYIYKLTHWKKYRTTGRPTDSFSFTKAKSWIFFLVTGMPLIMKYRNRRTLF